MVFKFNSIKNFLKNIREREGTSGGGVEREGDTESEAGLQVPSCQHRARLGARIHKP